MSLTAGTPQQICCDLPLDTHDCRKPVTVPAGFTPAEILDQLIADGWLSSDDLDLDYCPNARKVLGAADLASAAGAR